MNNQTIDKMNQMRLLGMRDAFETALQSSEDLTGDELVSILIDAEWEWRQYCKMQRYIKQAAFRYQASVEEMDFHAQRKLNKNQFLRLTDCSFIQRAENVLITGPTGVGKSFIASAIGHQACVKGYRTAYFNLQKLFARLKMAKADQSYLKQVNKIARMDLLILDDFGLQPFDHQKRIMLLELIEDRHGRKSTIVSSQLPVKNWYHVIDEKTMADAILDRIIHQAHRIQMEGQSMRKLKKIKTD